MAHNFEMNTADFCSEELLNNRTFDEKFDSQGQAKWGIKGHGENIDKREHEVFDSFDWNPKNMFLKRGKKIW